MYFDPDTNKWTSLPDMVTARRDFVLAVRFGPPTHTSFSLSLYHCESRPIIWPYECDVKCAECCLEWLCQGQCVLCVLCMRMADGMYAIGGDGSSKSVEKTALSVDEVSGTLAPLSWATSSSSSVMRGLHAGSFPAFPLYCIVCIVV